MKHSLALTSVFASAALLSACGGGGGGNAMDAPAAPAPSPLDAVAPQASQSAAGLTKYLAALGAMPVEDREPVDLSTFAPPAADDTEPELLS
jgi:hypothetical protein